MLVRLDKSQAKCTIHFVLHKEIVVRYLLLLFVLCSGCSFAYSMSVGPSPVIQAQKEDRKIDWVEVFSAASDDKKHVRMFASVRFKAGIDTATVYVEDKGKKYEIGNVTRTFAPRMSVTFDLKTKCREWKTPFSSAAKIVTDSENVELFNIKVSIISK